ncbi:hypothetical protein ACFFUB_02540 [Algimonas porphyrae]|uniref:Uncharacterized protein n=1 Tax=Algimonas porphyrae TaxID=1128113 RepID=A0ABQ5V0M8_9PROT|nr:hypothetical protein [Algimonas porphyrae]GLQ20363.1 hypothetical protein GCM10007854_13180 [Algimonas porphyrae]
MDFKFENIAMPAIKSGRKEAPETTKFKEAISSLSVGGPAITASPDPKSPLKNLRTSALLRKRMAACALGVGGKGAFAIRTLDDGRVGVWRVKEDPSA